MSLNNIQLSAATIHQLFRDCLIENKQRKYSDDHNQTQRYSVLGKNKQGIVILVNNEEAAYLPDDELNFLLGILSACKLTMEDAGIVNYKNNAGINYSSIAAELNAEKVFLFGVNPADIALPLSFPHYQVQHYNNQVYVSAPALVSLKEDRTEKGKLWNSLKNIFSI